MVSISRIYLALNIWIYTYGTERFSEKTAFLNLFCSFSMMMVLNVFLAAVPVRQIRYHDTIWVNDFIRMRKQRIYGEKVKKPVSAEDKRSQNVSTILSTIHEEESAKIDWNHALKFSAEIFFILVLTIV